MRIWTQKSASIQKRTSPLKFDNFAEKSEKDTVSYLSSKVNTIAVFGASGRTGSEVVLQALERGEKVSCLVRDRTRLKPPRDLAELGLKKGSMNDYDSGLLIVSICVPPLGSVPSRYACIFACQLENFSQRRVG